MNDEANMTDKRTIKTSFCCDIMRDYVKAGTINQGIEDGFLYVEIVGENENIAIDFCPFCGRGITAGEKP